jgi:hypothetical protein
LDYPTNANEVPTKNSEQTKWSFIKIL